MLLTQDCKHAQHKLQLSAFINIWLQNTFPHCVWYSVTCNKQNTTHQCQWTLRISVWVSNTHNVQVQCNCTNSKMEPHETQTCFQQKISLVRINKERFTVVSFHALPNKALDFKGEKCVDGKHSKRPRSPRVNGILTVKLQNHVFLMSSLSSQNQYQFVTICTTSLATYWTYMHSVMRPNPGQVFFFFISHYVILHYTKYYNTKVLYFLKIYNQASLHAPTVSCASVDPTSQVHSSNCRKLKSMILM
jgi:hypothetical protein